MRGLGAVPRSGAWGAAGQAAFRAGDRIGYRRGPSPGRHCDARGAVVARGADPRLAHAGRRAPREHGRNCYLPRSRRRHRADRPLYLPAMSQPPRPPRPRPQPRCTARAPAWSSSAATRAQRLVRCLEVLRPRGRSRVVYVDSGSTDGSAADAARAPRRGRWSRSTCAIPFTAARAQRGLRRRLIAPAPRHVAFVQFLDGDCELARRLDGRGRRPSSTRTREIAAVCGRRLEDFLTPPSTKPPVRHRMEHAGAARRARVRRRRADALAQPLRAGGQAIRDDLIAGEEPEPVRARLRAAGWKSLAALGHDADAARRRHHAAARNGGGAGCPLRVTRSPNAFHAASSPEAPSSARSASRVDLGRRACRSLVCAAPCLASRPSGAAAGCSCLSVAVACGWAWQGTRRVADPACSSYAAFAVRSCKLSRRRPGRPGSFRAGRLVGHAQR